MMNDENFPTLAADRLAPLLSAAGFTTRELPGTYDFGAEPPRILHHMITEHGQVVAVLEWIEDHRRPAALVTELAVYQDARDLPLAEGGPISRMHARVFGVTFAANVPAQVVCGAAVAAAAGVSR